MSTALLIIDVQAGILEIPGAKRLAVREHFNTVRGRIAGLVCQARSQDVPIVFIQHDGDRGHHLETGTRGWELCDDLGRTPDDVVVRKTACDSFYETNLQSKLIEHRTNHLVIAGLMTQYCVDTTCRRAVSLGYDVTLVADAHTTADTETLTFEQIVQYHNALLEGFDAGKAMIRVKPASSVDLNAGAEKHHRREAT